MRKSSPLLFFCSGRDNIYILQKKILLVIEFYDTHHVMTSYYIIGSFIVWSGSGRHKINDVLERNKILYIILQIFKNIVLQRKRDRNVIIYIDIYTNTHTFK